MNHVAFSWSQFAFCNAALLQMRSFEIKKLPKILHNKTEIPSCIGLFMPSISESATILFQAPEMWKTWVTIPPILCKNQVTEFWTQLHFGSNILYMFVTSLMCPNSLVSELPTYYLHTILSPQSTMFPQNGLLYNLNSKLSKPTYM